MLSSGDSDTVDIEEVKLKTDHFCGSGKEKERGWEWERQKKVQFKGMLISVQQFKLPLKMLTKSYTHINSKLLS